MVEGARQGFVPGIGVAVVFRQRGRFLQRFGEHVAVAGGERDSAEGSEGWGDVGGRDRLKVLAGLDAEAHQQNGDVLIVVVGYAVAGTVGTRVSEGSAIEQPVRLWQDE